MVLNINMWNYKPIFPKKLGNKIKYIMSKRKVNNTSILS